MRLLILLAALGTAPAHAGGELVDGIACVVNDEVITLSEVYDTAGDYVTRQCGPTTIGERTPCTDQAEQQVAQTLILQALIQQKLAEVDMDVTEQDLDRTIDQIMRDNGIQTREQFRQALSQQGYTWDVYRDQLRDQVRMLRFRETFLRPQISLSEDEVRDAYKRAVREQMGEDRLDITYLAFPIDTAGGDLAALELKAELAERAATLDGPGLDQLGEVGGSTPRRARSTYTPAQLVDELKPIMELQIGQVGGPYRLGNSYFLVRLDGRQAAAPPPLEQVRPQLEAQLMEKRLEEEAEQWYQYARRSASVQCTFGTPE